MEDSSEEGKGRREHPAKTLEDMLVYCTSVLEHLAAASPNPSSIRQRVMGSGSQEMACKLRSKLDYSTWKMNVVTASGALLLASSCLSKHSSV